MEAAFLMKTITNTICDELWYVYAVRMRVEDIWPASRWIRQRESDAIMKNQLQREIFESVVKF